MKKSINTINRNFPHNSEYSDQSFLGTLHGPQEWNEEEYWVLDKAIYDLANNFTADDIPRNIAWPIMRVYSHLMLLISAHYNSNDGFTIKNIDELSINDFIERSQLVVEGFFKNKMPKNSSFEKVNPLL